MNHTARSPSNRERDEALTANPCNRPDIACKAHIAEQAYAGQTHAARGVGAAPGPHMPIELYVLRKLFGGSKLRFG